jgi:hypothetical protein
MSVYTSLPLSLILLPSISRLIEKKNRPTFKINAKKQRLREERNQNL